MISADFILPDCPEPNFIFCGSIVHVYWRCIIQLHWSSPSNDSFEINECLSIGMALSCADDSLEVSNALWLFYERCGKILLVSNFDTNTSMEMLGCQKSWILSIAIWEAKSCFEALFEQSYSIFIYRGLTTKFGTFKIFKWLLCNRH